MDHACIPVDKVAFDQFHLFVPKRDTHTWYLVHVKPCSKHFARGFSDLRKVPLNWYCKHHGLHTRITLGACTQHPSLLHMSLEVICDELARYVSNAMVHIEIVYHAP